MKKTQKGFTLVELIVVIAIIGILAAILVPSMMGYVKKSRLKTANSNAKTAYNAVASFVADEETAGTPWTPSTISGINCASDVTITSTSGADDKIQHLLYQALADNGKEAGLAAVCADKINGKASYKVQWVKTSTDTMVGQYPDPESDPDVSHEFGTAF